MLQRRQLSNDKVLFLPNTILSMIDICLFTANPVVVVLISINYISSIVLRDIRNILSSEYNERNPDYQKLRSRAAHKRYR